MMPIFARSLSTIELNIRFAYQKYVRHNHIDSPPFFIVGCGNSGTTLLLKILGTHSRIHPIHFESRIGEKTSAEQRTLTQRFDKLCIAAGKKRWVEKTPRNIYHIHKLLELHKDSRVIVLVRDGRDVALSLKQRYKSYDLGVERWVKDSQAALPFLDDPGVALIKYEDLIEDFEGTVARALNFVQEEFECGMREFYKSPMRFQEPGISSVGLAAKLPTMLAKNDKVESRRSEQIHQPIFDARGRWREQLSLEELNTFYDMGGETLKRYGYEI